VALRNIDLLLQKQPDILNKELRVFFCKYNDPTYVKFQKLEIMVRIANDRNVDQLLAELKEYALEVDMDFVRRAVKAIGQVAIKIESASEKCVNTLLDLINTKVNYVVQEAIVVIKDIFRKYPGYEGIIPTLCKCIDELDEPNARAALIWIVGEYAEKISNAGDILGGFVDGFNEEFSQTQLQILTAVVKLFLKRPEKAQGLVQRVLQAATAENDNPDVRDRAYIYWRLLSNTSDSNATKNIVLSDKPPIVTTISSLPPALLDQLLQELSTLSSVYHKPPEQFVGQGRFGADAVQRAAIEYVSALLSFYVYANISSQGTTSKRAREPLGCGCSRRGQRRDTRCAGAKQRRELAGHRFRRWRPGIRTPGGIRWHVRPRRSGRYPSSDAIPCCRCSCASVKQQSGRLARCVWGLWPHRAIIE
jgi:vesicle coat complex subunit